nr:putative reverse transcriptase domain-containing protein [Tanacetum cinerariifolium]
MTTVNQGMSVEEIKQVVAQRVANAIEAIAIYEAKTNIALKSMSQTKRQKEKVAENASNKRKWEGNHNGSSSQQNKGHKVPRAHTAWQINKKAYAGSLPLCNQCKFLHNGPCTFKNTGRKDIISFWHKLSATREDDKPEGKQVKDVPIVQDFPKVLSEKLPGLPPARPVNFQIDHIPGVAPVVRAPYHLTPSEMKELSEQLHELSDKGFYKTQFLT